MTTPISALTKNAHTRFGNKAACLGELLGQGEAVPPGFALGTAAFHSFLRHNRIACDPACFLASNDTLQQAILSGSIPPALEQELDEIFRALLKNEVDTLVVRSSALCEDAENASFAGILESVLPVRSLPELRQAVKMCYASLLSDKALAYCLEQRIPFGALQMGLVIQLFIPGKPSGVLFTADTIKMDPGTLILNWVDGPCAAYVQGAAHAQTLKLPGTGALPPDTGSLSAAQAKELLALGKRCARLFGKPQDIEWTFAGDRLYVLQSRAITTLKEPCFPLHWDKPEDAQYTWHYNCGPVKPADSERFMALNQGALAGAHKAGLPWFYNELYFANGYMYWRTKDMPDSDANRQTYDAYNRELAAARKNVFTDIYLPRILAIQAELEPYLQRELTNSELAEFLDKGLQAAQEINAMHWLVVQGSLSWEILERFRERFTLASYQTQLLVYRETMLTRQRHMLMEMVQIIQAEPDLLLLFQQHTSADVIYAHLPMLAAAAPLRACLDDYMHLYGMYQMNWDDFRLFSENPAFVMSILQSMRDEDPAAFFARKQQAREDQERLTASLLAGMNPGAAEDFRSELEFLRSSFRVRDNHSHYIDATHGAWFRKAQLLAGERLVVQNIIALPDDVFFLRYAEVRAALAGNLPAAQALVNQRREIFSGQAKLWAPPVIGKPETTPAVQQNTPAETVSVLSGFSGLGAVVQGEVRTAADLKQLVQGKYIFVFSHAHETDFPQLRRFMLGMIFDWDSPFDHVGIWTREIGIPTLFGTRCATTVLKSGMQVVLDGIKEEVRIVAQDPLPEAGLAL